MNVLGKIKKKIVKKIKKLRKLLGIPEKISYTERTDLAQIESAFPLILSFEEMLEKIKAGASLARFGDAEFDIMMMMRPDDFYQRPSHELSRRLLEVLMYSSDNKLIVAIPPFNPKHSNIVNYYKNISFWEWYWLDRWKKLRFLFGNVFYGNSLISRDMVFYEVPIEKLLDTWDGRDVVFVVPSNGRFAYDERLFGNMKSHIAINVPATHAFADYSRILSECLTYGKDKLFFLSCGPTATVLAFDLAQAGYQALDMGHFPNCYLEFIGEGLRPEAYPPEREKQL